MHRTSSTLALDNPKFTKSVAITLFATQLADGSVGCDQVLWKSIWEKVLVIAAETGWQQPQK